MRRVLHFDSFSMTSPHGEFSNCVGASYVLGILTYFKVGYQKKNMKRSLYVKECDKRNGTVGKSIRKQCGDAYA